MTTGKRIRTLLVGMVGLLPHCAAKRLLLHWLLGWQIHRTARFGPCILLHIGRVTLRENSELSGFSVYHGLEDLELDANAIIGRGNWIGAASSLRTPTLTSKNGMLPGQLKLGRDSAITSFHYIDCSGGVAVGSFSVVGGVRSTILTHQVELSRSEQEIVPVRVGEYCYMGSNVQVVPGAVIPDRCVIAMGSVVVGELGQPGQLYAGVPARAVRPVTSGRFFERTTGWADIP